LKRDPIEISSGDFNFYRFGLNNPINNVDPFGYWSNSIHALIIRKALGSKLSKEMVDVVIKTDHAFDNSGINQLEKFSYLHSMIGNSMTKQTAFSRSHRILEKVYDRVGNKKGAKKLPFL
jgi:uncharacterized protein RhaS with RHS repeats